MNVWGNRRKFNTTLEWNTNETWGFLETGTSTKFKFIPAGEGRDGNMSRIGSG